MLGIKARRQLAAQYEPQAVPVAAPSLLGIEPLDPSVTTPPEAQARLGPTIPSEAHQDLRAKQRDRVFGKGLAPSDEGLEESQDHIGSMDVHNRAHVGP